MGIWWFPSTCKIHCKNVGFFFKKNNSYSGWVLEVQSCPHYTVSHNDDKSKMLQFSLKVHFKFSVPLTYCAFKMELKASLIYRDGQNLELLL